MAPEDSFPEFSFLHTLMNRGIIAHESFLMEKNERDRYLNYTKVMHIGVSLEQLNSMNMELANHTIRDMVMLDSTFVVTANLTWVRRNRNRDVD